MAEHKPIILPPPEANDDEIIARHPPIPSVTTDDDSPLVVMELLQRIKIREVMRTNLIVLSRRDTMRRAQDLMRRNHITGIPIAEGGRLYGIVSVEDIIRALTGGWIDDVVARHMSTHLIVLEADMPLAFALKYFENYNYGRFPVLNKEHCLVGLVSQRDITRTLLYELTMEINKLEKKTAREEKGRDGVGEHYLLREWSVVHNDLENAGKAANDIKAILREREIDRRITRRIAVAAYELEINICIHSHGGALTFMIADDEATVVAKDTGPGIPDIVWACKDGTSTANDWIRSLGFGAGMGLANAKRVSDRFDIASVMGKGTTVTCKFKLTPPAAQEA